jgi:two-component system phosphate regulon sensor histidine kinase PhoR
MFHSIRWRITILYVLLILTTMLGLGLYLSNFLRQTYLNDLEAQLATEAHIVGDILQPILQTEGIDASRIDSVAKTWGRTLNARLTIIAPVGRVLGESDEDYRQMDNHRDRPEVIAALADGQGSSVRFSRTVGYDMLYTAIVQGEGESKVIVRVAVPLDQVQANIARLQRILFSATLLATLLAAILAAWIASRTSRPVQELEEAVRQMADGQPIHLPGVTGADEIGQLAQSFNSMSILLRQQIRLCKANASCRLCWKR